MTSSTQQLLNQVFPKSSVQVVAPLTRDSARGRLSKRHSGGRFLRNAVADPCSSYQVTGSSAVLSLMLPQSGTEPNSALVGLPSADSKAATARVFLPFQWLPPFTLVEDQLSAWGVRFEGAIAINPSNPSFFSEHSRRVVMPTGDRHSLVIHLLKPLAKVSLQVRGYRDISVSALDEDGHCISQGKTFRQRLLEQEKAPVEQLQIELGGSRKLVLGSSGPFALEFLHL